MTWLTFRVMSGGTDAGALGHVLAQYDSEEVQADQRNKQTKHAVDVGWSEQHRQEGDHQHGDTPRSSEAIDL